MGLAIGTMLATTLAFAGDAPWVSNPRDDEAVQSVWTSLNHKDCPRAVRDLNAGVAKGYPGMMLLAGAMFESGICLKPSWERAATYYQRAETAGHPQAAARLASGYAAPVGGPDKAAALWWALRAGTPLPSPCVVAASLRDDADGFVRELRSWPAGRVDACVYVAGVMATISGDVEFSARAAAHGLHGDVVSTFVPAMGSIEVNSERLEFANVGGVVSGDLIRDRNSKSVKLEFERDLKAAGDRALKRYAKPTDMDPSWRVSLRTTFAYVWR